MVKKVGFLTKYQKRSLDQSFIPKAILLFGNASKRARTCFNTQQAQVCVLKGTSMCTQRHKKIVTKIPFPQMMTFKTKKVQNFKIFNRVPMCVYIYYGVGNVQYWCYRPQRAHKTLEGRFAHVSALFSKSWFWGPWKSLKKPKMTFSTKFSS